MNGSRDCHTEGSKPEGEKQISYINTHIYLCVNCGVGEDTLESPLDCKEIQPDHPNGNQS